MLSAVVQIASPETKVIHPPAPFHLISPSRFQGDPAFPKPSIQTQRNNVISLDFSPKERDQDNHEGV